VEAARPDLAAGGRVLVLREGAADGEGETVGDVDPLGAQKVSQVHPLLDVFEIQADGSRHGGLLK
jgi:hypothetical protein